jgi:hypothetical protein
MTSHTFALLEGQPVVHIGNDGGLLGEAKDVGAKTEDARGHVLVRAVDEADEGDHGAAADDHTDERQDAAQLVRPQPWGRRWPQPRRSSLWMLVP